MAPQNTNRVKLLALFALIIAAGCYFFITNGKSAPAFSPLMPVSTGQTSFSETGVTLSYSYDSAASFYANGNGNFYYCTKDGVKYMDSKGVPVWEDVFTMMSPVMVGEGSHALVAEPQGSVIYMYGPNGRLYTAQFSGMIINYALNTGGYSAITIKQDETYETQVLNATGSLILDFKHEDANIFPICADVSNDGRIASVSLLDISGVSMTSHIISAYLNGKEAKSYSDGIFGSVPKDKQITAVLKFLRDGHLIGFSDTQICRIELGAENTMESGDDIDLNNKIDFFDTLGDAGFVLAFGDLLPDKSGDPPGLLAFYDEQGVQTGAYALGAKCTYLSGGQNVVAGANRTYYAFNNKGRLLWRYDATRDYKQLIFLENTDTILCATNTEAVIMKRGK